MSNPFDDSNPFADPSIQNVTQSTQKTQMTLEDYNPFTQNNTRLTPPIQPPPPQQASAAIIPTAVTKPPQSISSSQATTSIQPVPPPSYSSSAAQNVNIDSIQRQQEELARKAAELDRKEQALRNAQTNGNEKVNNFPPLPAWCPWKIKPCFYQDIAVEIPVDFQRWVRILFYLWIFHSCTLFFNVIGALVVWIATDSGVSFGLALLYFFLFTPCSYLCWFRPAYKAFRSDSSANFMIFFFMFFIQCIVSIIQFLGIDNTCGIVLMSTVFSKGGVANIVAGVFVLLISLCFLITSIGDVLVLIKIHRLYRNTGASFEQAQKEFASNVLSNKTVQNAATTVVVESAKATASSYASNSTTPGRF